MDWVPTGDRQRAADSCAGAMGAGVLEGEKKVTAGAAGGPAALKSLATQELACKD